MATLLDAAGTVLETKKTSIGGAISGETFQAENVTFSRLGTRVVVRAAVPGNDLLTFEGLAVGLGDFTANGTNYTYTLQNDSGATSTLVTAVSGNGEPVSINGQALSTGGSATVAIPNSGTTDIVVEIGTKTYTLTILRNSGTGGGATSYESIDELNHLAHVLSDLDQSDIEKFEAVIDSGEYTGSVHDLINLAQNLDCYDFYPGIDSEEALGRAYIEEMEMLDVPDNVLPYFDFEAYGRDARINDGGHFAPGGYVFNNGGSFVERYHGMEDIPPEHRIFAYPKLSIREQMAAYQEVIDRSALNEEKLRLPTSREDR